MEKVLVTGGNGQLGCELREACKNRESRIEFLFTDVADLDITNENAVREYIKRNGITAVVNCAAYTAVDKAEDDIEKAYLLNGKAPSMLARAINEVGGSMVHISTDYVFDGTNCTPYGDDDEKRPLGVYGKTKSIGEEGVLENCKKAVVIRTAWLYSEFGNNFVKTMLKLGRERNELSVVFDQIGTPTYARDLADTIVTVIDKGVKRGIYNFTNEGVCSWYDFAKEIHRLGNIEGCEIKPIRSEEYPTKAERPKYSVLDNTKIKKDYGIHIRWWKDALAECVKKLINDKNI